MNLTNHFLVAMPGMKDPYFQNSVIYLCEHNDEGAMGLMINAPIDVTVGSMLKQVEVDSEQPKSNQDSDILVLEKSGQAIVGLNLNFTSKLSVSINLLFPNNLTEKFIKKIFIFNVFNKLFIIFWTGDLGYFDTIHIHNKFCIFKVFSIFFYAGAF